MHTTITSVKQSLSEDIRSGKICLEKQVAPQELTIFQYHRGSTTITQNKIILQGRMIALVDIRMKLQKKHHSMGILWCTALPKLQEFNTEQLINELVKAHGCIPHDSTRLEAVKTNQTTSKIWHDHGKIAGHGHLLVLVASIFYEVFFYTTQEMAQRGIGITVPTIVKELQLYLLACSGSSDTAHTMKSVFWIP